MAKNQKFNYRIILAKDNKEIEELRSYVHRENALKKFNKIVAETKEVIFPVRHLNSHGIKDVKYNVVLIKKYDDVNEVKTKLRNEYGEFVDHETTSREWYIFDIAPYEREETFWVYGYHPRLDRKDFLWVYENIVKKYGTNKLTFLNIRLYNNKILINTYNTFDMVICKNKSDGIRFYNLLEEYCLKDKIKYVIFGGDCGLTKQSASDTLDEICKHTGWNRIKAKRSNTRP